MRFDRLFIFAGVVLTLFAILGCFIDGRVGFILGLLALAAYGGGMALVPPDNPEDWS